MKRIKCIIGCLFIVCVFSFYANAQKVFPASLLIGKTWVQETPSFGKNIYKWSFDKNFHTRVMEFEDGENIESVIEYYLSRTKETGFNHEKVGLSNTGQYIIFYRKQSPELPPYKEYVTDWYEILSLTPEKLVVKSQWGVICTFSKK